MEIYNELKALRLSSMAEAWKMIQETRKSSSVSLDDGLSLLLQAEREGRENKRTYRLLYKAKFRYEAQVERIDFNSAKGRDKDRILALATCGYIKKGESILITGAAGTGKSYLATAFGHQACLAGYSTLYFNMMKLSERLSMARLESNLPKFFDKLANTDLLIIDEWGLKKLENQQLHDFMEVIEDRHARKSTIITSQVPFENWYDVMAKNQTIADAICDRMIRTSHKFTLSGESYRK